VSFEAVEGLIVEGPNSGILDGTVHPLGLAVGPRVIGLGEFVDDAVVVAEAIEGEAAVPRRWTRAVARLVGEGCAVVGQDGVELVGEGGDRCAGTGRRRAWWPPGAARRR
jgi:hypothetical protein